METDGQAPNTSLRIPRQAVVRLVGPLPAEAAARARRQG